MIARQRLLAWLAFSCLTFLSGTAMAQTDVSGAIAVDTHWTVTGSPYLVGSDVLVQNRAVLTIDAGVTVYMALNVGLSVQVGSVRALGTTASPIRVLSERTRVGQTAAPGDWKQWIFTPGASNTRLEHVLFENGSGLVVQGASPVFNYLNIRNQQGAAITIDLAASPSGVGNQASGNGLNGIAVPAGDIVGNVQWGLLGIPYVVSAGTVSVGRSPGVSGVVPATIERGQTINIAVDGVRLDGLSEATFDSAGLSLTALGGSSSSRLNFQVTADAAAELGSTTLRLRLDPGELVIANAFNVTQPLPAITVIDPTSVVAGTGVSEIVLTGRNFTARSEVLVNSVSIPARFVSATELRASLPNQTVVASLALQVRIPDGESAGQYLLSNSVALTVRLPVPPVVSFEPTPIALPPDGKPHGVTLRLSKADFVDHTINLSVSDGSKASVSPMSLVIAAGQTTATVYITPLQQSTVSLRAQSATLGDSSVPLFITVDFRGINTSYALPVGVFVQGGPAPGVEARVTVLQGPVGVGVGAVLGDVSPGGWPVGTTQSFEIHGIAIPGGSQVEFMPATGLSVGPILASPDGSMLSFPVTAAVDAEPGSRRVVVHDNNGTLLTFADPRKAIVGLTGGLAVIDSVAPLQAIRNSSVVLVVRGQNLQKGRVELLPSDGIEVDSQQQVNTDGTVITVNLRVTPAAVLGAKVIQVTTSSGPTPALASSGNTMSVVSAFQSTHSAVSPIVGVVVGNLLPIVDPQVIAPILTSQIGVVVGATVLGVAPHIGVVDTSLTVTVRGQGLQGVTSVSLAPAAGVVVGPPVVNAEGTELTVSMQVDAAAALGLRRLAIKTANGPLAFANVMDGPFLIAAPLPEIASTTPQFLGLGGAAQTVILRGRYFTNVVGARLVPSTGVSVNPSFTSSSDGTALAVSLVVDATAATGPRTLIVTTAAGDSTSESLPGNTVTLATQVQSANSAIVSRMVGVLVGENPGGGSYNGALLSSAVGVLIPQDPLPPITAQTQAVAMPVRLLVGAVASTMSTDGWLQGSTGILKVTGVDLGQVESVSATPSVGLLFDAVSINQAGTELSVPISVAQDAVLGSRQLHLRTSNGEVVWAKVESAAFGIGRVPAMDSVSPIVFPVGAATTLSIRGHDLAGVTGAMLLPGDGVEQVGMPAWSQDQFGELLKVTLRIQASATTGSRVLQLLVPGGATSSEASAVNTLTLVPSP